MTAVPLFGRQLAQLRAVFPQATVLDRPDGSALVTVPEIVLPDGYDRRTVAIAINLPAGYPTAKPSGFETDPGLRLSNGAVPTQGRGEHIIDGRQYAHYCWQPGHQWDNDDDELWKRVKFAFYRFLEHHS